MRAFIGRRIALAVVTLLALSILVFAMSRALGNPVDVFLPIQASREDREALIVSMGLDKPMHEQYLVFLRELSRGDLGKSIMNKRPVIEIFRIKLWNTLQLASVAFLLTLLISLPVGVIAAVYRGSWQDWSSRGFAFVGQAVPDFWLGITLILLFAVYFNLLPPAGKGGASHFVLPVITLGWSASAGLIRITRSSMLETLASDYIRTARAKGLGEFQIIAGHAFKNASIPILAFASGLMIRGFIMGSIIIETVFGWPGVGRLAFDAVSARDYPLVQGTVLMIGVIVLVVNTSIEVIYGWIDPRVRLS